MLRPAFQLLENEEFWWRLSDGLAVFLKGSHFEYYTVPISLPSFVYVGNEFYLRHLLPLVKGEERFFLLALSQGKVRFFEGHKHHITPVIIRDLVPEDLEASMMTQSVPSLQYHSAGSAGAMFHGQGGGKDQRIADLENYFRAVDNGLMEMLYDENAPMVLAAVDYLVPIYREVASYPHIVEQHISGNPDREDPVLLHEKAVHILRPYFQSDLIQHKEQFDHFLHEGQASTNLSDVVQAAQEGRVDTLFVDKDSPVLWGFHQQLTNHAVSHYKEQTEFNTCLLNYAALQSWKNGGTVHLVSREEMPQADSPLNAMFRY